MQVQVKSGNLFQSFDKINYNYKDSGLNKFGIVRLVTAYLKMHGPVHYYGCSHVLKNSASKMLSNLGHYQKHEQ